MRMISDSFSFIFRDPDWPLKMLVGSLFVFLSMFLIGIPVLYGYLIELLQRVRRNEQRPLPEWKDPGIKFLTGLKYCITLFLYYLPFMIILLPIIFMTALVIPAAYRSPDDLALFALLPPIVIIILVYTVLMVILTPFIAIRFAVNERIGDGLSVGKIFRSLGRHGGDAIILFLLSLAVSLGSAIGLIVFIIGIFATSFYSHCVTFHLYGQLAQSIDAEDRKAGMQL